MRILFLDGSAVRHSWHVGYGGLCINAAALPALADDLTALKKHHGMDQFVEIKWSPAPDHFLRTRFCGTRHDLYKDVLELLSKYDARVLCAVHALKECYGVTLHSWSRDKATRWAAKQQLRFIAERYERPYLRSVPDIGLIVCDEHDAREEDAAIARQFTWDRLFGLAYESMEHIAHVPLTGVSSHSAPLQIADVIIGVVTSAMAGGCYGRALFDNVARHFLWDPHEGASAFSSVVSHSVLGFGFKVFPVSQETVAQDLFKTLDEMYVISENGWRARESGAGGLDP